MTPEDSSREGRLLIAQQMSEAFPLKVWHAEGGGVDLRPLTMNDLPRLLVLLGGDRDMTWTRNEWGESNVRYLLRLRLQHYSENGFGVYGVVDLDSGDLIGMAGAQFWSEDSADVEVIAYIDKESWNQGLATRILSEIVNTAFEQCEALAKVVAATRHDNASAQAVARSLGMQQIGEGMHYGAHSIYWAVERASFRGV